MRRNKQVFDYSRKARKLLKMKNEIIQDLKAFQASLDSGENISASSLASSIGIYQKKINNLRSR